METKGSVDRMAYFNLLHFVNIFKLFKFFLFVGHIQSEYLEMLPEMVLDIFDNVRKVDLESTSWTESPEQEAVKETVDALSGLKLDKEDCSNEIVDLHLADYHDIYIGGYLEEKMLLEESVVWFHKYPTRFRNLGISPCKGTLLYGPPGCGKTLLAKQAAKKSGANFVVVRIPDLVKSYVGESEKAIGDIFQKAKQSAPCILFLDEIDALFSGTTSDLNAKVCIQFCYELDQLNVIEDKVTVLAATNHKEKINQSILSSSRMDRSIYIGMPSSNDRQEIIKFGLARTKLTMDIDNTVISQLVTRTEAMTGSDIQEFLRKAFMKYMQMNNCRGRQEIVKNSLSSVFLSTEHL